MAIYIESTNHTSSRPTTIRVQISMMQSALVVEEVMNECLEQESRKKSISNDDDCVAFDVFIHDNKI